MEQDSAEAGQVASGVFELDGARNGVYDVRLVHRGRERDRGGRGHDRGSPTRGPLRQHRAGGARPDRVAPVTLSVQLTNDGNVDALGVPLFIEVLRDAEVEFPGANIARPAAVAGLR